MATKPPQNLQEWQQYQEDCWRAKRPDWIPKAPELTWPEGYLWQSYKGITFIILGPEDHPLQGRSICWRCLAEAQGIAPGPVPHAQDVGDTCWSTPTPDRVEQLEAPEDRNPFKAPHIRIDLEESPSLIAPIYTERVWLTRLDAEGRPVGERQEFHGTIGLEPPEPWDGFPSWTDAEPVETDLSEWFPEPPAPPVPAHETHDANGQPEEDDQP